MSGFIFSSSGFGTTSSGSIGTGEIYSSKPYKPQPSPEFMFLIEGIFSSHEYAMIKSLQKEEDITVRKMYYDYLLDKGRDDAAEMVAKGYTPGVGYYGTPIQRAS